MSTLEGKLVANNMKVGIVVARLTNLSPTNCWAVPWMACCVMM